MRRHHIVLVLLIVLSLSTVWTVQAQSNDESASVSITLAIDTSDSMWGNPINNVREAATDFVLMSDPSIPIAIVTFSNQAQVVSDFTTDRSALLEIISELTPGGVTALYDGATVAMRQALQSDASQNYVVLLSDGAEYGGQSDATRADVLALANSSELSIVTIGLGFGADRTFLEAVSSTTQTAHYDVGEITDIQNVFVEISTAINMQLDSDVANNQLSADYIQISDNSGSTVSNTNTEEAPAESVATGTTSIVLTVDVSQSMTGTPMNNAIEALRDYVADLNADIPVAIVTFSNRAEVVQDFTTDKVVLTDAINDIAPIGVTALYDGAYESVQLAASSGADNPIVILLSDGGEYGGQSNATPDLPITLAQQTGVSIKAIGVGFGFDRTYLERLTTPNNGELFVESEQQSLSAIYAQLSQEVNAITVVDAETDGIAPVEDTAISPLSDNPLAQSEFPLFNNEAANQDIAPLNQDIVALGIDDEETVRDTTTDEASVVNPDGIAPSTLEEADPELVTNFVPVEINVADDLEIEVATATINGIPVASFTDVPFTFEIDTDLLSNGLYRLGIQTQTVNGVVSEGTMDFEVESTIPTALESNASLADVDQPIADNELDLSLDAESEMAQKVITVNGVAQPLIFDFSPVDGLSLSDPVLASGALVPTLGEILMRPFDNIPQPVIDFVMEPRPRMVTATIILMTVILLPQGLFTIYWMTYSWVTPERLEKSSSPKKFYEPEISFTALVPARKEAAVIYDTIMSVNGIDYPEHLKETLILIRDEDDDETIDEAKRAIQDIRQSYWDRDEVAPDNVKLVTFTTGPYNKPNGLNRGYRESTKDVICIFDAEDQPHHEIYDVINTVMIRDDADVVQAGVQLMNFESKWFSAFNCLEYFFWFKSGLHAFTHALGVTPLGGNTVFLKKTWLDILAQEDTEMGYRCWDEEGLTEDADIGLRLTQMGANIQIVYDAIQATREETPDSVEQFIKQRTRWDQGFYQIFVKWTWLQLPTLKQRITAFYVLLNSILQGLIMLFLPIGLFIAFTQEVSVPIAILSYVPIYILIIQLGLNMVGIREFTEAYGMKLPLFFRWKMLLWFYPFQLLLSVSAVRAIIRFFTNQSAWEKTAHSNLHRQAATGSA